MRNRWCDMEIWHLRPSYCNYRGTHIWRHRKKKCVIIICNEGRSAYRSVKNSLIKLMSNRYQLKFFPILLRALFCAFYKNISKQICFCLLLIISYIFVLECFIHEMFYINLRRIHIILFLCWETEIHISN